MAKIDLAKIEGYENMTPEQKVAYFEAFEYDDNSSELDKVKTSLSKANSEAKSWKDKYTATLSEEAKTKEAKDQEMETLRQEVETLKKEKTIGTYKARFIAKGMDEELAAETAAALADGDLEKVFANEQTFLSAFEKRIRTEALGDVQTPPNGSKGGSATNIGKELGAKKAAAINAAKNNLKQFR